MYSFSPLCPFLYLFLLLFNTINLNFAVLTGGGGAGTGKTCSSQILSECAEKRVSWGEQLSCHEVRWDWDYSIISVCQSGAMPLTNKK